MLIPVLVGTFALYARAEGASGFEVGRAVESFQDFESYLPDSESVHRKLEDGLSFWSVPSDPTLVRTTVLEEYPDHDHENRYVSVNASERPGEGLMRVFIPREECTDGVTNAWASVSGAGGYPELYSVFRTKFALYDAGLSPECDLGDRLVIWAQKDPEDADGLGRLFVSAGRYQGDIRNPIRHDFEIASTNIDPEAWHEVTIRSIPDVSVGAHALGFELWIDGNPVFGGDDYGIADFDTGSILTAEAMSLAAQRRLFPSLTVPGLNTSVALGGVAFTGIGVVDDINILTNAPAEWAKAPRTFSLCWDLGVTGLTYTVGASEAVTVPASAIGRRRTVFEIPSAATEITVAAGYNTADGYSPGIWTAEGSCSVVTNIEGAVTNYSFRCDASSAAGTGYVRSFRNEIGIGGGVGAYASFADAKNQALAQGASVIVMNGDFAASMDTADEGMIMIDFDEKITIDLNGYSITNAVGEFPTIVNYGELTIVDSRGGGKVVPYLPFSGDTNDFRQTVIQNYASSSIRPVLRICGGAYDGYIKHSGLVTNRASVARVEGKFSIVRGEYMQDEPKFVDIGFNEFPYDRHLVDAKLYYAYEEPYWKPLTNAFIWCGKGADDKWSTPENWRCNEVPGADDYVIFPIVGTNVWEADLETGIEARDIWFAGDVILHGSADFTDVKWKVPADGRVRGDAVLSWNGKLPPNLATLLDESWAGRVVITDVGHSSPKLMTDLGTWGTASSTVVFKGVRGYYHVTANLTVPYTLELQDGSNGYGWKNDAGFTGAVIEFPRLVGAGGFVSPKNTIANQQIIIFRDIRSYDGVLDVKGKRVVLGPGDAATLEAGSITWSAGMKVRSGPIHICRVAAFGGTMDFSGGYDTCIAEYSDFTVGDSSEVVNMTQFGEIAELCVTNPVGSVKIVAWSDDAILVDGRRVVTNELLAANSQSAIKAPVNSLKKLTFARYYTPEVVSDGEGLVTVKLALNELAVPVIGSTGAESARVNFADGMVSVIVADAIEGFWYGLEYKESLSDDWPEEPYVWTTPNWFTGGSVELVAPAEGPSGFYRVVVTDVAPYKE